MKEKKVSSCIFIYDKVKGTVVSEHPTGRPWKNTDGSMKTGVMSLPKGEIDEGEDKFEAAIREVKEETGLKLERSKLKYLGHYDYTEYKDLEMFFYPMEDVDLKKLKCDSFFEAPNGKMLPEVNGFANLSLETEMNMFFYSLQKVMKKCMADWPDYFNSSKLEEQRYSRNKFYYTGRKYDSNKIELNTKINNVEILFLSNNPEYAYKYAVDPFSHKFGKILKVKIKANRNIFNANSNDIKKLKQCIDIPKNVEEYLKKEDWVHLKKYFSLFDRELIVKTIKDLGYDGFFNYEDRDYEPSIGLFNINNIELEKEYSKEEAINYGFLKSLIEKEQKVIAITIAKNLKSHYFEKDKIEEYIDKMSNYIKQKEDIEKTKKMIENFLSLEDLDFLKDDIISKNHLYDNLNFLSYFNFEKLQESSHLNANEIIQNIRLEFDNLLNIVFSAFDNINHFELKESTIFGEKLYNDANKCCFRIKDYLNQLNERIKQNDFIKKIDAEDARDDITLKRNTIFNIQKIVIKGHKYDEEDKENISKICQVCDVLIIKYNKSIKDYNVRHSGKIDKIIFDES